MFKGLWNKNSGNPETLGSDLQTRTISFPDDEQLLNDIKTKPFYGRRLDGYVLSELEIASHRTNPITPEQLEAITVDHLAPQSLNWATGMMSFPTTRRSVRYNSACSGISYPSADLTTPQRELPVGMRLVADFRTRQFTGPLERFLTSILHGDRSRSSRGQHISLQRLLLAGLATRQWSFLFLWAAIDPIDNCNYSVRLAFHADWGGTASRTGRLTVRGPTGGLTVCLGRAGDQSHRRRRNA